MSLFNVAMDHSGYVAENGFKLLDYPAYTSPVLGSPVHNPKLGIMHCAELHMEPKTLS